MHGFSFVQFSGSNIHESLGGAALEMDPDGLCPLLYLQGPMHSNYLNIS